MSVSGPVPIAWVSCVGEKGGAEALMLECLRVLDRGRYRPHVVLLRPGPLALLLGEAGVAVHVLPLHRMRDPLAVAGAVRGIGRIVREEGIQLLHGSSFRGHFYSGIAAWRAGIPEVYTAHTLERRSPLATVIHRLPTRRVLTNCPRTDDHFKAAGHPTSMIWPGVNVARLGDHASRAELARRFGLPAERRWVSVGARLQRYKGQAHFLRALAAVPAAENVHGIVIGGALFGQETDYEQELVALAGSLGIQERVTFTGFVAGDADFAGLLAASEIVVHPALEEDFGISVAEAQALGIPVVAYAAVGPAAIVVDGETGWLVTVGDEAGLSAALRSALGDAARRQACGAAGRARVRARFSAEEHARRTEAVYAEVLAGAEG